MNKGIVFFLALVSFTHASTIAAEILTQQAFKDTYLDSISPNSNFGQGWKVLISGTPGKNAHGLFHFDFASLPPGATIEDVKLTFLVHSNNSITTYFVHPLLRSWDESSATWNQSETGVNWSSPGGDYDPSTSMEIPMPTFIPGWVVADITSLVIDEQGKIKEDIAEHGLLIKSNTGYSKILSSEFSTYTNANTCHSCHGTLPPERDIGKSSDCAQCHTFDGLSLSGEPTLIVNVVTAVPTLSEWGWIILIIIILSTGIMILSNYRITQDN
jgi:hypothetical protein